MSSGRHPVIVPLTADPGTSANWCRNSICGLFSHNKNKTVAKKKPCEILGSAFFIFFCLVTWSYEWAARSALGTKLYSPACLLTCLLLFLKSRVVSKLTHKFRCWSDQNKSFAKSLFMAIECFFFYKDLCVADVKLGKLLGCSGWSWAHLQVLMKQN